MKILYNGFLKIKERFRKGNRYEVMDRGDSVTVLLVDPGESFSTDKFYIGRQYRAGADRVMETQIAGMIDSGETPLKAALREAVEEAGAFGSILPISAGFTSPGGCTEHTTQFVMFVGHLEEPTDKSEGIQWKWVTGEEIFNKSLKCDSGVPYESMQLTHSLLVYKTNRDYLLHKADGKEGK